MYTQIETRKHSSRMRTDRLLTVRRVSAEEGLWAEPPLDADCTPGCRPPRCSSHLDADPLWIHTPLYSNPLSGCTTSLDVDPLHMQIILSCGLWCMLRSQPPLWTDEQEWKQYLPRLAVVNYTPISKFCTYNFISITRCNTGIHGNISICCHTTNWWWIWYCSALSAS